MKRPNRLDFAPEEIEALIYRLENECLGKQDYPLLQEVLRAMIWLSLSLKDRELSIRRLRSIFGVKTESAKKLLAMANGESVLKNVQDENKDNSDSNEEATDAEQKKSDKKRIMVIDRLQTILRPISSTRPIKT